MEEQTQVDLFMSGQEKLQRAAEEQAVKDREAREALYKARKPSRRAEEEIARGQSLVPPPEPEEPPDGDPSNVEIPEDWRNFLAADKRTIADAINAELGLPPVPNATEATAVIEAELARRSAG